MIKKLLLTLIVVAALGGIGLYQWKQHAEQQEARAKIERVEAEILQSLTAEDVQLILENDAQNNQFQLATTLKDAAARARVLQNLRETLALAAQARRENTHFTETEIFKHQFETSRKVLLAQLYEQKKRAENPEIVLIAPDELAAIWQQSGYEEQFNRGLEVQWNFQRQLASEQGLVPPQKLAGEKLEKTRRTWAKATILAEKAAADAGFIGERGVQLRIKLLEAELLAQQYLQKQFAQRIKATEEEVKVYLTDHPEYDLPRKREKAATALRRAQTGEDFALLVKEFSEDRMSKDKSGLYENMTPDEMLPEVAQAVAELEKGQIAENLIESTYGWHIVKLENKKNIKKAGGATETTYNFRQILLHNGFAVEIPGSKVPSPFYPPEHIARKAIETKKQQQLIAEIIESISIQLPPDFDFKVFEEASVRDSKTIDDSPEKFAENNKKAEKAQINQK